MVEDFLPLVYSHANRKYALIMSITANRRGNMSKKKAIFWFRQDLRLDDNPGLKAASEHQVLPIYILENEEREIGGASKWWLYHALKNLNQQLDENLHIYQGDTKEILLALCKEHDIDSVHWTRCYEPWRIKRDKGIKQQLNDNNIQAISYNGSLLWEPWKILKSDRTPYKVFTAYYRRGCLEAPPPRKPISPTKIHSYMSMESAKFTNNRIMSLPKIKWYKQLEPHWDISEQGAQSRLKDFIQKGIKNYKKGRDFPASHDTSRLSPFIHFGQISPHRIWHEISSIDHDSNIDCFLSELGWREFSYYILYHFPEVVDHNLQKKFDNFPWQPNNDFLKIWQKGLTGYPIVDAGMRELWQTGYMHNRVRMIVGSFLVKNLLQHWKEGEKWFWDCLVDADLASNCASWQWVAGSGADAAPYFRIFNPVTQGEKFDPDGCYTKKFVPELKNLPKKYLFKPWEAPSDILKQANIRLGETYPHPIVDIKKSRAQALDAFQQTKK